MSTSSTFNLAQLFPDDYQDITVDDVLVVPISGGTATSGTFGNITNHNTGRAISTLETPTMNILDGILTVSLGYASGTGQTGYSTPDGFAPSGSGSATVIPTCKVYLKAPSADIKGLNTEWFITVGGGYNQFMLVIDGINNRVINNGYSYNNYETNCYKINYISNQATVYVYSKNGGTYSVIKYNTETVSINVEPGKLIASYSIPSGYMYIIPQ